MLPPERLPVPGLPFPPSPESVPRPLPRPLDSCERDPDPGPPSFRVPDLNQAVGLLLDAGGRLRGPSVTFDFEGGRVCVQHLEDPGGGLVELQQWD